MFGPRKETRSTKKDDKREQLEEAIVDASEPDGSMASVLAELKSFRKEYTDASNDTKATFVRVENTLKEVVEQSAKLEQQMTDIKERFLQRQLYMRPCAVGLLPLHHWVYQTEEFRHAPPSP
uniref:Uncharacterized protein n=1 Tax=Knipowitschia caucasica TaxID=637954 RepID=A0AAV2M4R8_KNICA